MSAPFQLFGGHPVLDLVNTLDNRFVEARCVELLPGYAEILRFARQSGLLSVAQIAALKENAGSAAASRVGHCVRQLREALAALLYARKAEAGLNHKALKIIEHYVVAADAHRELVSCRTSGHENPNGASWSWRFQENRVELPLWVLSKSAEALLTGEDFGKIRYCRRDACRWLFLDSSKNQSRRWCDMSVCGNRVKAQRFYAKQGHLRAIVEINARKR